MESGLGLHCVEMPNLGVLHSSYIPQEAQIISLGGVHSLYYSIQYGLMPLPGQIGGQILQYG